MSEGEGFLSRWSRRKRAAEAAAPSIEPVIPPAETEGQTDASKPPFDPASLPSLDSLTAESDFAAFLREEVPAALRRAALRRAWTLDPAIRDFVGPADYAWDFNAPDGVPGFSFELGGDLERLVAQAVGLGDQPERREPEPTPPAGAVAALPAEAAHKESAPEGATSAETPEEPALEALPVPDVPLAEQPTPRRRHGGALPT